MEMIGSVIKRLRKESGMTQALLCGDRITRNLLSQIENGAVNPSLPTLQYIADRLGVSTCVLFMSDNDRYLLRKEEQIGKLRALYAEGKDGECLALYDSLSVSDTEANRYCMLSSNRLADAAFCAGAWSDAEKYYVKASSLNPDDPFSESERTHAAARLRMISEGKNGVISMPFPDGIDRNPDRKTLRFIWEQIGKGYAKSLSGLVDGLHFENEEHRLLAKAMICEAAGNDVEGRSYQMRVNDGMLDPFLRLYLYTMSEKCCVRMNDFESAYRYTKKKQQCVEALKNK